MSGCQLSASSIEIETFTCSTETLELSGSAQQCHARTTRSIYHICIVQNMYFLTSMHPPEGSKLSRSASRVAHFIVSLLPVLLDCVCCVVCCVVCCACLCTYASSMTCQCECAMEDVTCTHFSHVHVLTHDVARLGIQHGEACAR